jgi:hypothetical protein
MTMTVIKSNVIRSSFSSVVADDETTMTARYWRRRGLEWSADSALRRVPTVYKQRQVAPRWS